MVTALPEYPYRLDGPFIPSAYEIYIEIVDLEPEWEIDAAGGRKLLNKEFPGRGVVLGTLNEATSQITFNTKKMKVASATVYVPDSAARVPASEIIHDEEHDLTSFIFPEDIPAGQLELELEFTGTFLSRDEGMEGLYQSIYELAGGSERIMAVTQLEVMDARAFFPCVDQPDAKAKFSLSVRIPADETAVSNMPVTDEELLGDGTKVVEFEQTPLMSTYLLALVVGQFDSIEATTVNGTVVRVVTVPGEAQKGKFALEHAVASLELLEEWYGVPCPLPKVDLIAVKDFSAGAMENWGAIICREDLLLVDEYITTDRRQIIAMVLAHELAHFWFGDLVTMGWWNDLWLNESFATFVAYKVLEQLHPEWSVWGNFLAGETKPGMDLAQLVSAHPIEVDVATEQDAIQKFDAISYGMGGSVLRMLSMRLGEENFRRGIGLYLDRYAYSNAEAQDLWNALSETSGVDVKAIASSWTAQAGFPVLTALRVDGSVAVTQKRLLADPSATDVEGEETIWPIPVFVALGNGTTALQMLEAPAARLTIPESSPQPVILNAEQVGFYRVLYESTWRRELIEEVKRRSLSSNERWGFHEDAYAFLQGGDLTAQDYLAVVEAYADEFDRHVWSSIAERTGGIIDMYRHLGDPTADALERRMHAMLVPKVGEIGWDADTDESDEDRLTRVSILNAAARFREPGVLEEAVQRLAQTDGNLRQLDPDLVTVVLESAARGGGRETFELFTVVHEDSKTTSVQRNLVLKAMGLFNDENILADVFAYSLSDKVRPQDAFYVWSFLPLSAKKAAWQAFQDHRKQIDTAFGTGFMIVFLVKGAIDKVPSEAFCEEVEAYFADNPTPFATDAVAQSLERNRVLATFAERNREGFAEFFATETV